MSATEEPTFKLPVKARNICFGMVGVGVSSLILDFVVNGTRVAWGGWLLASFYVTTLALFGGFFLALAYLSKSSWTTTMKRIPEAMTRFLPVACVMMLILLFSNLSEHPLYEWMSGDYGDPDTLHAKLLEGKEAYLNIGFFIARIFLFFIIWFGLTSVMVSHSRKQDLDGELSHTVSSTRVSGLFMVLMGLTLSAASWDWIMSLEPAWFSTMFGAYQFAGMFHSGTAAIIVIVVLLKRWGYLGKAVNSNHLHLLGTWLFAMSIFWAYIWTCQLLLIWYANMPEETHYYLLRWANDDLYMIGYMILPLINFAIPFLILLPRPNKRNARVLLPVAVLVLVGHFLDLWVEIIPVAAAGASAHGGHAEFPTTLPFLFEAGILIGFFGIFALVVFSQLGKAPLLAKKDPYYEESLHYNS